MATAKDQDPNTSQPFKPPYAPAISRVAVAQICLDAGYTGAEAAALRALADIAGRYIRLLAAEAASAANSRGRTQSNIFDLAIVLEDLAAGRGYAGAADITRPLLMSSVLHDLRAFVAAADEIPFPRPIRRQRATVVARKPTPSFAQVGKEPPLPHVPSWLPCFPEGWESRRDSSKVAEEKIGQMPAVEAAAGRDMMRERERVRFRLGFGVPFSQPIRRPRATVVARNPTTSFAKVGKEPPLPNVPSWLPCFPEGWESRRDSYKVAEKIGQMPAVEAATGRDMMREGKSEA